MTTKRPFFNSYIGDILQDDVRIPTIPKDEFPDDEDNDTADMCPRCFTIVPPDAKVCPKCGEKVCHNC